MNRQELQTKLCIVTSEILREKGYISVVDVFMKLGYLDRKDYEVWRSRRVPCLEDVIRVSPTRINFIMRILRRNSVNGRLKLSWTAYMSWGKGTKTPLRFSKSGEAAIERAYATHFVKGKMNYGKTGK
ncbi:MAG: hypothetical protein NTZ78_04320 [Candidatus Aureabacteria bacterium]|nr:hypothetical protein [Candidatus Auribacterota bacterium]